MKQCSKCKEWKDENEFYKDKTASDGFYSRCKKCKNTQRAIYSNSEAGKVKARQYQQSEQGKVVSRKAAAKYRSSPKGQVYRKEFAKSDKGRECQINYRRSNNRAKSLKVWKDSNPNKIKANSKVGNAIRDGRLQPPTDFKCQQCKIKQAKQYHHWSYKEEHWLDVIPLCVQCHANEHNNQLPIEQ